MAFLKSQKNTAIIIDIGSGSVSLGYASYEKDIPHVLYANRHESPLASSLDFDSFLKYTLEGVTSLSYELIHHKEFRSFEKLFCYLPTLLHFSDVRKGYKSFEKEVTVTKGIIQEIASSLVENFKNETSLSQKELPQGEYVILEEKVTNVLLNGYETEDPTGKRAQDIEVSLFISYTSSQILEKIARVGHNVFHRDNIEFHTATFAIFDVLRASFASYRNFLAFNLGAEISEVLVVRNNEIERVITYPFGYRTFLRKLASNLSTTLRDAETIASLYIEDSTHHKVTERIETALGKIVGEWAELLKGAFKKEVQPRSLPGTLILLGNPIFIEYHKKWFSSYDAKLDLSNAPLSVIPFTRENIDGMYTGKSLPKNIEPLLLKAIFSGRLI